MKRSDRKLGMNRPITRRDFVNGMAVRADGAQLVFAVGLNDSAALLLSAPLDAALRLLP